MVLSPGSSHGLWPEHQHISTLNSSRLFLTKKTPSPVSWSSGSDVGHHQRARSAPVFMKSSWRTKQMKMFWFFKVCVFCFCVNTSCHRPLITKPKLLPSLCKHTSMVLVLVPGLWPWSRDRHSDLMLNHQQSRRVLK